MKVATQDFAFIAEIYLYVCLIYIKYMERNFFSREQIRDTRNIKKEAKEISLFGRAGKHLESIQNESEKVLKKIEEANLGWIEKKKESLSNYLEGIGWEDIKAQYREGLLKFIKTQYRLFKKEGNVDNVENLYKDSYLEEIIKFYTFDFIISLRNSERLKIAPSTALNIAKLSYHHNPDISLILHKKFPEFEQGDISHAIIHSSLDPEGFLEKAKNKIPELQEKFSDFKPWIISYVVINHPTDTEDFLKEAKGKIHELQKDFPEVGNGIIFSAAIKHPKATRVFLENLLKKTSKLKKDFSEFNKKQIFRVAASNSSPEEFLQEARKKICELQEKYPDLSLSIINDAVISYPDSTDNYLEKQSLKYS